MAQVFKIASAVCKKVMQHEICLAQIEAMEMTVSAFLGSPWLQDLHDALAWQAARVDTQRPMPGMLLCSFKPFAWEGDVISPAKQLAVAASEAISKLGVELRALGQGVSWWTRGRRYLMAMLGQADRLNGTSLWSVLPGAVSDHGLTSRHRKIS